MSEQNDKNTKKTKTLMIVMITIIALLFIAIVYQFVVIKRLEGQIDLNSTAVVNALEKISEPICKK